MWSWLSISSLPRSWEWWMANTRYALWKTEERILGSTYVLKDETKGVELLDFPGATAKEVFDLIDSEDTDCADVAVLAWEYHGFSSDDPAPVFLDAATIEKDMKTLIGEFFKLAPDRKFGASTVLEWIDWFESAAKYAEAHPKSRFRSCFFE